MIPESSKNLVTKTLNTISQFLLLSQVVLVLYSMSVSFGVNELRGKNWINFLGERGGRVCLAATSGPD